MKKNLFFCILFSFLCLSAKASHITGGEMSYRYIGMNNGNYQYEVTLKLYQRCNSGRQFPNPAIISIFNKTNNARVSDINVNIGSTENISITNPDPCISNPPAVCYDVAYYTFTISLPASAGGYVMASQVNYRIAGITNLSPGYSNVGATYSAEIPGTGAAANGPVNNSARFIGSDLVIVCAENNFSYSFAAQDDDGDQLEYFFCEANASTSLAGGTPMPTNPPPFPVVPYNYPSFSESAPLGNTVQVNSATGLITGIAPSSGIYVVTVCVREIRNGQIIATQRKDLQIFIADCSIASASLLPEYLLCNNTQTINLVNQSSSPLIISQNWEVFNNSGMMIAAVTGTILNYTFPDTGVYSIKLIINRNQPCSDSTTTTVKVFPGFIPDFTSTGICVSKPTLFSDRTNSVYGVVNSWKWDFGELSTTLDVSTIQNPIYTYPSVGSKNARLIVTDSKGCRDTVFKIIDIIDKPPIGLAFRDTLICNIDNLMLQASGSGIFSWSPPVNIINANTATPIVSPVTTTTYFVTLDDNGCINRDSVKVRVVDLVTIQAMNDTTICLGDTIQLRVFSDGLRYSWTPASQIIDPTMQNPYAITTATTNYQVTAIIGGCSATDNIIVNTVPYPVSNAGLDTSICYNSPAFLRGLSDGSSWLWSPSGSIQNATLLNTIAHPPRTTHYVLTSYDTKGCPKPGRDTVTITVLPKMRISAGNDTAVITGQPLHLMATGGESYLWSPATYLSSVSVANPVVIFPNPSAGIQYKVVGSNSNGCSDSAFIFIKVYKTLPTVFVPSAFTPDNDGLNDLLRPIAVGIKSIEYFNIYNRWGQLLFSTKINGHGWDGKINSHPQPTGTFVWMVRATDYTGAAYFQKGVVTLIR
jgi:gliding motility-associated-like protein